MIGWAGSFLGLFFRRQRGRHSIAAWREPRVRLAPESALAPPRFFTDDLAAVDAEIDVALAREEQRQRSQLELIAPKNYMSRAAREALASIIAFTSAEGYPGERWHVDLRGTSITGDRAQASLEAARLPCNKHLVPGDPRPLEIASGVRFGTSAVTTPA